MRVGCGVGRLLVRSLIGVDSEFLVMDTSFAFVFDFSAIEDARWSISGISFRGNPAEILSAMNIKLNGTRSQDKEQKTKTSCTRSAKRQCARHTVQQSHGSHTLPFLTTNGVQKMSGFLVTETAPRSNRPIGTSQGRQ